jgi:hypothetical protein
MFPSYTATGEIFACRSLLWGVSLISGAHLRLRQNSVMQCKHKSIIRGYLYSNRSILKREEERNERKGEEKRAQEEERIIKNKRDRKMKKDHNRK